MSLRQFIFARRMRKLPIRSANYRQWDDIHSIIIFYESDYLERNEVVRRLLKELQDMNKSVNLIGYLAKPKTESPILPSSCMVAQGSFSFWGYPKRDALPNFTDGHWDLMLDFTRPWKWEERPGLNIRYLARYIGADLKVGITRPGEDLQSDGIHDMLITLDDEVEINDIFRQMLAYLKMIKTAV